MHEVVLCADEESLRNPSMLGLEGESLEGQEWLRVVSNAQEARACTQEEPGVGEIWVASSDEVDPINLAAAMKRDACPMRVCLVAWRGSGSLLSRASAAGIDEVITYADMARRYAARKGRSRQANPRRRTPTNAGPDAVRGRHDAGARSNESPDRQDEASPTERAVSTPPPTQPVVESAGGLGGSRLAPGEAVHGHQRGYALAVLGASGGTGKSTVAALSALIASGHGYKTVLVDADLQFGDIASMFEGDADISLDAAVADPALAERATSRRGHPVIVSPPGRVEQSELYLPQVPGLISRLRESFDVVVVNTGAFWTEGHIQIMEACSNALFLMDQRPTSVKAVRRALELCARCGVASHPFLFAVNRCSRKGLLSAIDISCALNGVPVAELKEGGPAVSELTSSGLAMRLVEDRNDLCLSLNDFLGGIIPEALGGNVPEPEPVEESRRRQKAKQKQKSRRRSGARRGRVACL